MDLIGVKAALPLSRLWCRPRCGVWS